MQTVHSLSRPIQDFARNRYPVKILQFGTDNFLLGFADWIIQEANDKAGFNAGVSVIQSTSNGDTLNSQEGVFTVILKGIYEEEFVRKQYKIDAIQRVVNPAKDFLGFLEEALNPDLQFIISNSIEGGIIFTPSDELHTLASSFPGQLTQLLYHRFKNNLNNGLLILPTELIEQNGIALKSCIKKYAAHWGLSSEFTTWITKHITFCNTLVDRIVSGVPKKPKEIFYHELGYADELALEGEWFYLWVIDGPRWIEEVLPFKKAGLQVVYTHDLTPYRLRKVRILNGAHSCMACVGYLAGLRTVRETIEHPVIGNFVKRMIFDDILSNLPGDLIELEKFAEEVIIRFRNPAIDHHLIAITHDSFSKFNVRVIPSLLAHIEKNGVVPDRIAYSIASLFFFYRGSDDITLNDRADLISFMQLVWKEVDYSISSMEGMCKKIFSRQELWGSDLTKVPQLVNRTAHHLHEMHRKGIVESLKNL
ncbi:MAG: tagaturonate reductase [Cyclobacteriaceae bacterium]|nr:tagaturonate reductase [Cyclobacteriaceae bacterium]